MPTITKLSEVQLRSLEKLVTRHLGHRGSLTNRALRDIASISYDQAITLFNHLVSKHILRRIGSGSGTRYELAARRRGQPRQGKRKQGR